jgi:hypothetical protein
VPDEALSWLRNNVPNPDSIAEPDIARLCNIPLLPLSTIELVAKREIAIGCRQHDDVVTK